MNNEEEGGGRKRQAEEESESGDNKRARDERPRDGGRDRDSEERVTALKFLFNNQQAGTIIGRGGQTISSLQSKSGARIKVSSAHDYFPGTQDRCVLASGGLENVASACELILLELFKNSDSYKSKEHETEGEEIVTVNILIPDLSCGQVIGKGGENIKRMVEESACQIKLTNKDRQIPGVPERVLTNSGKLDQVIKATDLVFRKLWDHERTSYQIMGVSYRNAAPYPPGGGGGRYGDGYGGGYGGPPPGYPPPGGHYHDVYPGPSGGYQGGGGYGGPPYGGGHYPAPPPPRGDFRGGGGDYRGGGGGGRGDWGGGGGGGGGGDYRGGDYRGGGGHGGGDQGGNWGGAGAGAAGYIPPTDVTYTVQVPDHVVPMILGKGGQTIKEMIDSSGASIKVSQKGEYAQGTQNRIITITGAAHAASYAHQLVSSKIPNV